MTVSDQGCVVLNSSLNNKFFEFNLVSLILHNSAAHNYFKESIRKEDSKIRNVLYAVRNVLSNFGLVEPPKLLFHQLLSEYDTQASEEVNATLKNIKEMSDFSKRNNLTYVIVNLPSKLQIYDNLWEDYKIRNKISNSKYDLGKSANILNGIATSEDVFFIDVTLLIKNKIISKKITESTYYYGDEHFNILGNQIVGEILFEEFKKLKIVK